MQGVLLWGVDQLSPGFAKPVCAAQGGSSRVPAEIACSTGVTAAVGTEAIPDWEVQQLESEVERGRSSGREKYH